MNKLKVLKKVLGAVASLGVNAVVSNIVIATTPKNLNTYNKVVVGIGGFVLSSMISSAASNYVEKEFDEFTSQLSTLVNAARKENHGQS